MINYGKTQSTVKPSEIEINEYFVYINKNIQQIESENQNIYEFDMTEYTKDEYIKSQIEEITSLQLALCEVYERIV